MNTLLVPDISGKSLAVALKTVLVHNCVGCTSSPDAFNVHMYTYDSYESGRYTLGGETVVFDYGGSVWHLNSPETTGNDNHSIVSLEDLAAQWLENQNYKFDKEYKFAVQIPSGRPDEITFQGFQFFGDLESHIRSVGTSLIIYPA
ncbi:MAG: hypothetical protein ACRC78_23890 [Planktothrix sp.]